MWKLLELLAQVGLGLFQGFSNASAVEQTNQTNLQIARETNKSNVEQANLAYLRSLPLNQVNNLMAAGLSRQGALSTLSGGGSYIPPTLQGATMQAPQKDFSSVINALGKIDEIPSSVEQHQINQANLDALRIENNNKIAEERRAQEKHEFDMWKEGYNKNTALALDSGSSKVANALIDSGKTIEDFKDFEDMLRQLGLDKDKDIRNLNYVARQQLEDGVRSKFDSERARQQQENTNRSADDAHKLSILAEKLQNINLKYADHEHYQQLLNIMRNGQNLIEDGRIKFQDARSKEFENYVRELGIDSEADARALGQLARKMAADDELDVQMRRRTANDQTGGVWNQTRVLLRDLGELFFHVKLGN